LKINDQLKRSGLSNSQLFSKIDVNSTSTIEKQEFIQFFQKDLIVKGLTIDEIHLAFDSLDMNKDGVLSINEFCLLLEGVQHNFDQKLRQFDPELEKTLKDEINMLFDFFDTNKDNVITQQELESALKS
jgi:Ca2+-binding EF-hand superfamily protein